MYASAAQHQTPQDYVLSKINRIYDGRLRGSSLKGRFVDHRSQRLRLAKRHQVILRYRKRLVRARALFKQELDKALQSRTQKGLGMTVSLDERYLARAGFIAHFEFEGKRWIVACQRKSWHCEWFFKHEDQISVTRCSTHSLEVELCYALGQFCHHNNCLRRCS